MNSGVGEYLREESCLTKSVNRASHFVGVRGKASKVLTGIWRRAEAERRFAKIHKRRGNRAQRFELSSGSELKKQHMTKPGFYLSFADY